MAELYPENATLEALSGTTDATGLPYIAKGTGLDWYSSFIKMIWSILSIFKPAGDLRVFKDGSLTFGVKSGKFYNGATAVTYTGATAQALTDNATNYIYLTAAGTLTVNTTAFPAAGTTPCLPLATIVTLNGTYTTADISDYRSSCMFNLSSAMTPANANTLVGGTNANALHIHAISGLTQDSTGTTSATFQLNSGATGAKLKDSSGEVQIRNAADGDDSNLKAGYINAVDGFKLNGTALTMDNMSDGATYLKVAGIDASHNVTAASLANAVADSIPKIGTITIGGTAPKTASFQLQDVQGNSLSAYGHVEAWLSDSASDRSITTTTPDGTVGWTTGVAVQEITSKIHWSTATGSTGAAVLSVAHTGAAHTWYLCVSVNGLTYVSAAITLGA